MRSASRLAALPNKRPALEILTRVLAVAPEHVGALVQFAFAARHDGQLDEAMRAAERAVELEPGNVDALVQLGWCRYLADEDREALRLGDAAVAQDPTDPAGWRVVQFVALYLGEVERSLDAARQLVALVPEDTSAHVALARALEAKGDRGGAREAFRSALRLDPDESEAHAGLALLEEDRVRSARHALAAARADPDGFEQDALRRAVNGPATVAVLALLGRSEDRGARFGARARCALALCVVGLAVHGGGWSGLLFAPLVLLAVLVPLRSPDPWLPRAKRVRHVLFLIGGMAAPLLWQGGGGGVAAALTSGAFIACLAFLVLMDDQDVEQQLRALAQSDGPEDDAVVLGLEHLANGDLDSAHVAFHEAYERSGSPEHEMLRTVAKLPELVSLMDAGTRHWIWRLVPPWISASRALAVTLVGVTLVLATWDAALGGGWRALVGIPVAMLGIARIVSALRPGRTALRRLYLGATGAAMYVWPVVLGVRRHAEATSWGSAVAVYTGCVVVLGLGVLLRGALRGAEAAIVEG